MVPLRKAATAPVATTSGATPSRRRAYQRWPPDGRCHRYLGPGWSTRSRTIWIDRCALPDSVGSGPRARYCTDGSRYGVAEGRLCTPVTGSVPRGLLAAQVEGDAFTVPFTASTRGSSAGPRPSRQGAPRWTL